MDEPPPIPRQSRLRRAVPWLIGIAILAVVARRMPVAEFKSAIGQGPHIQLGLVSLATMVVVLCSDSLSTWIGLLALRLPRPLSRVFLVRGGTYLLFLINYALGQGAFGYYLNRTGVSGRRSIGATLFLIGTNLAALIVVTTVCWVFTGVDPKHVAMWWTLLALCGAFVVYLVIIAIAPRFIARIEILAPLFDGGLRGHAIAIVGRLPHIAVLVLTYWAALRIWGIPVPLVAGVTLMPGVIIASVLPFTPGGFGTTQAAFVYFFSQYAAGATPDERQAHVLAFAIVYFVYLTLAALIVGFACTPFAKKLDLLPRSLPAGQLQKPADGAAHEVRQPQGQ